MNTLTQSASHRCMTATLLAGALAMSFAARCPADDTGAPQSSVKYADLNVSSHPGAAALYARIGMAAGGVCRAMDGRDLESKALFARCVHKAISEAVIKVNQPALYAIYNAKNANAKPIMLAAGDSR